MFQPRTILNCALAIGLLGLAGNQVSAAQQPNPTPGVSGPAVDLRIQLEKGLKARLPREFDFIEQVVHLVDTDQLPRDLVESTFLWARAKKPYPFPYFETGLRVRAARRGIQL